MSQKLDCADLLTRHRWVAETNIFGLWVVGPETDDGLLEVRGMGRTLAEAIEHALFNQEEKC